MPIPIRTIALGLLLTCTAMPVLAQSKSPASPEASAPTAKQPASPLDLVLRPSALPPFQAAQTRPIGPALPGEAVPARPAPAQGVPAQAVPAELTLQTASEEVRRVVRWVTESKDNTGLPFALIDKVNAQVFAFNGAGRLVGATPALLGLSRGDRLLAPNDAPMSAMPPGVRITPAGRFVSRLAIDSHGKELLVLDYDASISLHAVVQGTPEERRAERLQSATSEDNRISFGCINVPVPFYTSIVSPTFAGTKGIVYVLPETGPASRLFGFQAVSGGAAGGTGAQPVATAGDRPGPGSVAK